MPFALDIMAPTTPASAGVSVRADRADDTASATPFASHVAEAEAAHGRDQRPQAARQHAHSASPTPQAHGRLAAPQAQADAPVDHAAISEVVVPVASPVDADTAVEQPDLAAADAVSTASTSSPETPAAPQIAPALPAPAVAVQVPPSADGEGSTPPAQAAVAAEAPPADLAAPLITDAPDAQAQHQAQHQAQPQAAAPAETVEIADKAVAAPSSDLRSEGDKAPSPAPAPTETTTDVVKAARDAVAQVQDQIKSQAQTDVRAAVAPPAATPVQTPTPTPTPTPHAAPVAATTADSASSDDDAADAPVWDAPADAPTTDRPIVQAARPAPTSPAPAFDAARHPVSNAAAGEPATQIAAVSDHAEVGSQDDGATTAPPLGQARPQSAAPQTTDVAVAAPPMDGGTAEVAVEVPRTTTAPSTEAARTLSQLSHATIETTAQIAAQISRRLEGRSTRFDMVLTPEDLGRVEVQLEIDSDGRLAARLAFDNPAAATDLRGRADELRRQLQDSGFQLADNALDFSQRDTSSGGGFDRRQERNTLFAGGSRLAAQADAAAVTPAAWINLALTPDRVDMKV